MNNNTFDRTQGLGGSDIPVLLGFTTWKTPTELYLEKTGEAKEDILLKQNTRRMLDMGKILEPNVIKYYQEETGEVITRQQERILHPEHNFLWGTIDGVCNDLVLEVKTTASYVESWKNSVPIYVLSQVAYYSHLLNSPGAKIVVMFRDNGHIRTYNYHRDLASEKQIIDEAIRFWEKVQKKTPPNPANYKEAQILFKNVEQDKKVIASPQEVEVVSKMLRLKKEINEKEKQYDDMKRQITCFMQEAPILEDGQGACLATWNLRNTTRLDRDKLEKEYPGIYKQCVISSTTRNFSLKTSEPRMYN
jgi:predicted phage-related endonuclease